MGWLITTMRVGRAAVATRGGAEREQRIAFKEIKPISIDDD